MVTGDLGESNSRSLAPKASIIPLDQSPLMYLYLYFRTVLKRFIIIFYKKYNI